MQRLGISSKVIGISWMIWLALSGCAGPAGVSAPGPTLTAPTPFSPSPEPSPTPQMIPTLPVPSATPAPTPTETALPEPRLCSPLAVQPLEKIREIITQPFIMPRILGNGTYSDDAHHGVDLGYYTRDGKPFTGTPVLAALDGKIAAVIHDRPPYGNMLMIETPHAQIPQPLRDQIPAEHSLYTLYAHLQNLQPLALGDAVNCGTQIAETGLTGFSGGPHLHFETRHGPAGQIFASMAYYRADASKEELANYERWRMSGEFILFDPMELLEKTGLTQ